MSFIEEIKQRARKELKTIILPESTDTRVLKATEIVLKEGFAKIVLIGDKEEIIKISNQKQKQNRSKSNHLLIRQ